MIKAIETSYKAAWYCKECGRQEQPPDQKECPECGMKMQRCSRYEWFLFDELRHYLELSGREFRLLQQYSIEDHRGFFWYFDIFVWVKGHSFYRGYGELIEVNGPDHATQAKYSGPGGGYTRDQDKRWEVYNNLQLHKKGIEIRTVTNDECTKKGNAVRYTAMTIVDELIERSDTWC